MRVLQVLGRAAGGIGAHVDTLRGGLRAGGHDVVVATDAATATTFGWDDARLLWPVHRGPRLLRGPLDWHRVMRLCGTVDVVHAHGHQAAVVAAVAVARARPRPRLVVSLHNDLPPAAPAPLVAAVRWSLRRADLVTGASGDLVELADRLGARRVELATVASPALTGLLTADRLPDAERERLLRGVGADPERPLVVTVSRLAPQKDLTTLVAAAAESRCGATWVVIGGGDEAIRADLSSRAAAIPAERATVLLTGPRRDVSQWLRAADVFALSSRWEARALVVQEAMAAGLPVVATLAGGLPALVDDAGVLVPVGDAPSLARAVDGLLEDPATRAAKGSRARALAASWDSPEDEARRWAERYAEALRG